MSDVARRTSMTGIMESHRNLLHEVDEDKSQSLFLGIEELRQRRAQLHAAIQEELEAQANLLGLDRDREIEDLREEIERLQHLRTNLSSRIHGAIETHAKLLDAREEQEERNHGFKVEENLKVLKRPESQPPKLLKEEQPKSTAHPIKEVENR